MRGNECETEGYNVLKCPHHIQLKRIVWKRRYQKGNLNSELEEQTMQWQKKNKNKNGQKDKQWSVESCCSILGFLCNVVFNSCLSFYFFFFSAIVLHVSFFDKRLWLCIWILKSFLIVLYGLCYISACGFPF